MRQLFHLAQVLHLAKSPGRQENLHGRSRTPNTMLRTWCRPIQPKAASPGVKKNMKKIPNSNGLQPSCDGLQPSCDGLQPTSDGLPPTNDSEDTEGRQYSKTLSAWRVSKAATISQLFFMTCIAMHQNIMVLFCLQIWRPSLLGFLGWTSMKHHSF